MKAAPGELPFLGLRINNLNRATFTAWGYGISRNSDSVAAVRYGVLMEKKDFFP
jgi:hypothetical protein